MRRLPIIVGLALLLATAACRKGEPAEPAEPSAPGCLEGLDESSLHEVVACFYAEGEAFAPIGRYALLARASRQEVTEAQWLEGLQRADRVTLDGTLSGAACQDERVAVLGFVEHGGVRHGRVQRRQRCRRLTEDKTCTFVRTDSWVMEDGRWRRLVLPATARAAGRLWDTGQYAAMRGAARAWLEREPTSVSAMRLLGWAMMRGVGSPSTAEIEAHIEATLQLSEADSEALLVGPSIAPTVEARARLLDRFEPTDCLRRLGAFNTALHASTAPERLAILDRYAEPDDAVLLRFATLMELERTDAARKLLHSEAMMRALEHLPEEDPPFAAAWGASIARGAAALGAVETARKWLQAAVEAAPGDPALRQLMDALPPLE